MKTVIILCLPRSGSSLLSGMLHRLGVRMGTNKGLVRGRHANKYGNYENQDFLRLSFHILTYADSYSLSWADTPDDEKVKKSVRAYRPDIKRLIKRHEAKVWGWKDPTLIYSLPYFEDLLTDPYYIVLKRNVESVAESHLHQAYISNWYIHLSYALQYLSLRVTLHIAWRLLKRFISKPNMFNDEQIYNQVIREGYKRIDEFVEGKKHICVEFSDLIEKPARVINDIVKFLDIDPSARRRRSALSFIDHDEIHFRRSELRRQNSTS
ncbi:MAG: sulfotransferase [Promethearchaeia archaeon]